MTYTMTARFYRLIRAEFAHGSQSRARYRNYVVITWRDYVGLYYGVIAVREPFERAFEHGRINRMRDARLAKRATSDSRT